MASTLKMTRLFGQNFASRLLSTYSNQTVGLIGVGNMGKPMAQNLLKNNFPLVVFDINQDLVNELKKEGVATAQNAADLASKVDVVVTMLPTNQHVLDCYLGPTGVLKGSKKNIIAVDSSTVDPIVSETINKEAAECGVSFLDAPVSGGTIGAKAGTLTFMVGGEATIFEAVKPVLQAMGSNLVHCGKAGAGQSAKICNNMLLAISMIGVSEALNMGEKLGLDPKLLTAILNSSTGRCWSSEKYNPVPGVLPDVPPSNNYEGGFQSQLMCKDLGLAQDISTRLKCPIPLGAAAHQFYRLVNSLGDGEKDFAYVYQYLKGKKQ